jgi:multidrug efflux pump subunit AcrA (membrane-fusion protein)
MLPDEIGQGDYCIYPPRIADEVDVTEQVESGAIRYVVRNRATSRYFLLRQPEYQIFLRIDGTNPARDIASPSASTPGPRATREAAVRFLNKLDSLGLLARNNRPQTQAAERGAYYRIRLFNPDRLLTWVDAKFGWALTRPFITASFVLMALAALGLVLRASEALAYTSYTYEEYGLATILLFTLGILTLHEMAHGLACKHFGGEVREVGLLMIFYVVPAFYCNVSDIYRFGRKRERLWVIGAGIYWQLLVSASGAVVWLIATPQTLLADFAFLVLLGGTFNVAVNCNPLIKLDGYYALSQIFGVQNLQAKSAAYVRSIVKRVIDGPQARMKSDTRFRGLYAGYWVLSIAYSVTLVYLIVTRAGDALMDRLGLVGVLLTVVLGGLLGQRFCRPVVSAVGRAVGDGRRGAENRGGNAERTRRAGTLWGEDVEPLPDGQKKQDEGEKDKEKENGRCGDAQTGGRADRATGVSRLSGIPRVLGAFMSAQTESGKTQESNSRGLTQGNVSGRVNRFRPRLIKAGLVLMAIIVLVMPWEASAGSDCALLLPPGHESAARANTDAVLAEIYVQPGDAVAEGARIARLTNPEMEDRLTQLNAEMKRLETNNSEIEEEMRMRSESLLSASFKERDHERLASELKDESRQIASSGIASGGRLSNQPASGALPPAMAVLKSEIELKQIEVEYNRQEVGRYKKLFDQGLVGSLQYDAAVNALRLSEKALERAKSQMEASLVEHRRLVDNTETGSLVARTEARAARSNFEALIATLHSNREQIESLRARRDILQKEYDGMNVVAQRSGVVLGEDLRKLIGSRYTRGQEICRIGELERFLLKIDVSERDIAQVRLDSPVRFKLKTVPGRTFTGRVSKINAEGIPNQYGQRFYPVEVLVENGDGLLRPGMTGFARISFGRQSIGLILAQKLWQALRPELWLF